MAIRPKFQKTAKYASKVWKTAMKTRQRAINKHLVWQAGKIAARYRVPREKFAESLSEQGIENTLQQLQQIDKLCRLMQKNPLEVVEMLKKQKIQEVFHELAEEFEEQQAMQEAAA